jgi:hypothetical protein
MLLTVYGVVVRQDGTLSTPRSHYLLYLANSTLVTVLGANQSGATCRAPGLYVTTRPWAIKGSGSHRKRQVLSSSLKPEQAHDNTTPMDIGFYAPVA